MSIRFRRSTLWIPYVCWNARIVFEAVVLCLRIKRRDVRLKGLYACIVLVILIHPDCAQDVCDARIAFWKSTPSISDKSKSMMVTWGPRIVNDCVLFRESVQFNVVVTVVDLSTMIFPGCKSLCWNEYPSTRLARSSKYNNRQQIPLPTLVRLTWSSGKSNEANETPGARDIVMVNPQRSPIWVERPNCCNHDTGKRAQYIAPTTGNPGMPERACKQMTSRNGRGLFVTYGCVLFVDVLSVDVLSRFGGLRYASA